MSSSTSGLAPSLELRLGADESSTTRFGAYPVYKVANVHDVDEAVEGLRAYLLQTLVELDATDPDTG